MFDFDDSIICDKYPGYRRKYCRAYCDICGGDRGYLQPTPKNQKHVKCVKCRSRRTITNETRSKHPNVDFNDFIIKTDSKGKNKTYYRCRCSKCGRDRGYHPNSYRWDALCVSCVGKGRSISENMRIKISCTKQNIAVAEFSGYKTNIRKREREDFLRSNLVQLLFKSCNYTCEACGQIGGALNAHHKECWHANVGLRYEINNLACLCYPCHRKFHQIYGYKNNTQQQFMEFITQYKLSTELTSV